MDISTLYRRAPCRWVNADGEDIHRQEKKYDGRVLIGHPSYNGYMVSNVGSYG